MKIVAQVKLQPGSAFDADALAATLRACNRAANAASAVAFAKNLKRRNLLQDAVYHRIKADFDLGAQVAVRTIKKVCDAYATLKGNLKAGNLGPEGSKRRVWAESKPIAFREARHAANTNHIIAKQIVATAERTSRGIALEDLKGIRQRVTAKKDQRARLSSWAFAQLGAFVEYKARRAGVPLVYVDPRNTSRQCSECWHTHRSNRVDQAEFACRSCGIVLHADLNGSRNIAHRGEAAWQRGAVKRPSTA